MVNKDYGCNTKNNSALKISQHFDKTETNVCAKYHNNPYLHKRKAYNPIQ